MVHSTNVKICQAVEAYKRIEINGEDNLDDDAFIVPLPTCHEALHIEKNIALLVLYLWGIEFK